MTRQGVEPGSPEFLAIERALEAAEFGDVAGGVFDGDGD